MTLDHDVRSVASIAPATDVPGDDSRITAVQVRAYTIPTDAPESDGTLRWDHTTIVIVQLDAAGCTGLGYTYADAATASLILDTLAPMLLDQPVVDAPAAVASLRRALRNLGTSGVCAAALSAIDCALWDLRARIVGLPLVELLGAARDAIDAYGSGGFCSYDDSRLASQLGGWAQLGARAVKLKVGREPERDVHRVEVARDAVGDGVELYVDANGAFAPPRALAFAERVAPLGVTWFEEPVTSDAPDQLRLLRSRMPAPVRVVAGEYGWTLDDSRRLLEHRAVDVLQVDATRCGGVTGVLEAAALARAFHVPLSAHCAPSLHAHPCCSIEAACNVEYFHDHARIEQRIFDGAATLDDGRVRPDRSRPGTGLTLREADAAPWLVLHGRCTEGR
jgi:L-alanine-DL-glutamate epimerase-like enolase superfamily enzyme